MTTPAEPRPPSLAEKLDRFQEVLRKPGARVYCATDTYHALLRNLQPGAPAGPMNLLAGVTLVLNPDLSPGTIVALAPMSIADAPPPPPVEVDPVRLEYTGRWIWGLTGWARNPAAKRPAADPPPKTP